MKQAVSRLLKQVGRPRGVVSILLTTDQQIHEMNLHYRSYDKPTDVLSFCQQDFGPNAPIIKGAARNLLGDVVISVETAERQARVHKVSLEHELALLGVHGVLHLLGHEDETVAGSLEMQRQEKEILGIALR